MAIFFKQIFLEVFKVWSVKWYLEPVNVKDYTHAPDYTKENKNTEKGKHDQYKRNQFPSSKRMMQYFKNVKVKHINEMDALLISYKRVKEKKKKFLSKLENKR